MKKFLISFLMLPGFHMLTASGNTCMEAVSVSTGIHTTPSVPYWYSFTMTEPGKKLIVSSIGHTTTDTYLWIYGDCDGSVIGTSDDYHQFQSHLEIYGLTEDQTVYIFWDNTYSSQTFNWSLSTEDVIDGEVCENSQITSEGTNTVPAIAGDYFWTSFTMTASSSKIEINTDWPEPVYVYSGNCDELTSVAYGYQNVTVFDVAEGETVYFQWFVFGGSGFSFDLELKTSESGESCLSSVTAIEGTNTVPVLDDNELYWYEFTMPSAASSIVVSAPDLGYMEAYRGSCSNRNYIASGTNFQIYDIEEGEKIFLAWRNYSSQQLEWELSAMQPADGESCSTAVTAVEGENSVPNLQNSGSYWYKFTVPNENSKITISSINNGLVAVYTGNCANKTWVSNGYQNLVYYSSEQGEEIYLEWTNDENFNWSLSVDELAAGDNCDMAVEAIDGNNVMPTQESNIYWYTFTMPEEDAKIAFSMVGYDYYLEVYTGSCENLTYLNSNYGGNLTLFDVPQGETLFIKWEWYHGPSSDLSWNLSVDPIGPGDQCETPMTVAVGTHTTPYAPFWYSYTVTESNKKVVITSVGQTDEDTYLIVVDECNGSMLGFSDDHGNSFQSQVSLSGLEAGDNILIYWHNEYSIEGFNWKLSLEGLPGMALSQSAINVLIPEGSETTVDVTLTNDGQSRLDFETYQAAVLAFDGYDDFMYIPNSESLNPSEAITIGMWVNLAENINCDGNNNFRFLLQKGFVATDFSGYDVILEDDHSITWSVGTSGGRMRYNSGDNILTPNRWTYLTFSYSASTGEASMYFDGVEVNGINWDASRGGSSSWGGSILPFYTDLYINYPAYDECANGFGNFPGMISHLNIWSVARSSSQIRTDMNRELTGSEQGLVGLWNFEEVDFQYIYDLSPNSNDATIFGPTLYYANDVPGWMSVSPSTGRVSAGASHAITLTFDSEGLAQGEYKTTLKIRSQNDDVPVFSIPVSLMVDVPLSIKQEVSSSIVLGTIYPNPMIDRAKLSYFVNAPTNITFVVYSLNGTEVFRSDKFIPDQGTHELEWDGRNNNGHLLGNGTYVYRIEAVDQNMTRHSTIKRVIVMR